MDADSYQILLLEDNDADVYLLKRALHCAGVDFELTHLEDGAEGLAFVGRQGKYAGRQRPDVAILDLNLPKHDGTEVLAAIRQSSDLAAMPVVIVSSSESPEDLARVSQFQVDRFLTKPPRLDDFLQIGIVLKDLLIQSRLIAPPAA